MKRRDLFIIIIIKIIITIIIMMTSLKRVEERSSEVEEGRLPATAATSTRSLWILSISKRLLIYRTRYRANFFLPPKSVYYEDADEVSARLAQS